MTRYQNFLMFERKYDVRGVDLLGNDYYAKEKRTSTIVSGLDNEAMKFLSFSVSSASKIDFDTYDSEISIEAYDRDNLTNRVPREMHFLFNPNEDLTSVIKDFKQIVIPKVATNSLTDITLSSTKYIDETVALSISGISIIEDAQLLKIEVNPSDFVNKDDYYRLLDLYKEIETISRIAEIDNKDAYSEIKMYTMMQQGPAGEILKRKKD